ncbi:helix-turn-helix domain-containing protein [Amycolatopsis sp. H20-H5]|uniref:helix-turn-helix domain-containing protein n=1 Tax=Amycolatopsis sp. H20-H5 TaxID=3046309 RepID=UPI002DB95B75|nr:helix-turn-helix transcriptional regulator [Amycolatopsis sp. H20-H5]MEC3975099.1 helix-turn-helix transcriptional regulator [Amycolatopsis sp. H20-H5]
MTDAFSRAPMVLPVHIAAVVQLALGGTQGTPPAAAERLAADVLALPLPEHPHNPLTVREVEVLDLVARGLDSTQIAPELHIAYDTSKAHIRNILRKLGARNRAHAVAISYYNGLRPTRAEIVAHYAAGRP